MSITQYKQEQGKLTAGTPGRFDVGRQGLAFVNPISPQVDNYDVTTGDATAGWSITVTNDATLASITLTWDPPGATEADAASSFIAAWNSDPNALVFARATEGADSTEFDLTYADSTVAYTAVVTPAGAGAGTLTSAASSNFNQGFGFWAFRTLTANIVTDADARRLVNPSGSNVLENCAGVTIKALNEENPERGESQANGFYRPGRDVPVMRRGYIWVPVTVAVKPGDAVHAIITGADAGKTTNTGALDLSSIASFTSVAAAGENAEVELTLA